MNIQKISSVQKDIVFSTFSSITVFNFPNSQTLEYSSKHEATEGNISILKIP